MGVEGSSYYKFQYVFLSQNALPMSACPQCLAATHARSFCVVGPWKMATVKSLEDMLTLEVDESAVNALVGSLESQLASTNASTTSQDATTTSASVNHVNSAPLSDGALLRVVDGQKHAPATAGQPATIGKPPATTSQVADGVPVSSTTSTVVVTLPGALPASGYMAQVTGTTQQAFFAPSTGVTVGRTLASTSGADIKIVYTTPTASTATAVVRTSNVLSTISNGTPTPVTMIAVPIRPGQTPITGVPVTTSMNAMLDLANIASQQTPIMIPSTYSPSMVSTSTVTTQSKATSKPTMRMQLRDRGDKTPEKITGGKLGVTTRAQEAAAASAAASGVTTVATVTQATVVTTTPKTQQPTAHHVNVVSQVVTNPSILAPGVQIINVNQRALTAQALAGAKTLAPRVVLSNNLRLAAAAPQIMTATRPGVAGQMHVARAPLSTSKFFPLRPSKNTITLPQGVMRSAILVKTENGPLQVVNLANAGAALPGGTYRLQSIQPGTQGVRTVTPQQMTVAVPVTGATIKGSTTTGSGTPTIVGTILPQGSTINTTRLAGPNIANQTLAVKVGVNGNISAPLTIQTTTANNQTPSTPSQMSPNTAKKKCKNFLSTLIRLADEQPPSVAKSVRSLIQGIIDGTIQAEEFTAKLQKELNSAPQPYLVPFLKKNLPFLRHSLITKELTIEGVRPPPPGALSLPHPATLTGSAQHVPLKRPLQPGTQVRLTNTIPGATLSARLLQANQNIFAQRFAGPRLPGVVNNQGKNIFLNNMNNKFSAAAASPATVGALQGKSQLFKGTTMFSAKDKGKNSFSTLRDDDDINDVAAMGGVNLIEESQKILASNSEIVGTQIRSCKDESSFVSGVLQRRVQAIAAKQGLQEIAPEVTAVVAHASQEKLKNILGRLAVIAEHRVDNPKVDSRFEVMQDVKSQIRFLEELDRLERRRHEEQEREILLRAAKSRSKLEDPEQLKLKQKAKEMQRAELEEMRQREANTTALLAIGPRKKMRLDATPGNQQFQSGGGNLASGNSATPKTVPRPRVKRVTVRDLLFLLEQDRESVRTPLLYKSYFK